MSISISKLKSAVDSGLGPAMSSLFSVDITLPAALGAAQEAYNSNTLSILCQSASMPGTQFATADLPVYGPPIKMPYGLIYQDLSLTFLCTNNMSQRKIFEEWRRIIVDPTSNYVNYYDTYVGKIRVKKLSPAGKISHWIDYEEAYPLAILEQEMASGNNDWLKLTVIMAYRRWRSKLDYYAADKADSSLGLVKPPGDADDSSEGESSQENPGPLDMFRETLVPKVPKFKP